MGNQFLLTKQDAQEATACFWWSTRRNPFFLVDRLEEKRISGASACPLWQCSVLVATCRFHYVASFTVSTVFFRFEMCDDFQNSPESLVPFVHLPHNRQTEEIDNTALRNETIDHERGRQPPGGGKNIAHVRFDCFLMSIPEPFSADAQQRIQCGRKSR